MTLSFNNHAGFDLQPNHLFGLAKGIPVVKPLEKKMGLALAKRSFFRTLDAQQWGNVAIRVAYGNNLLLPEAHREDFVPMRNAIAAGTVLMSGRHLQHGDGRQPERNLEVFTNCLDRSTKILTFEHGPVEIEKVVGQTVTVKARDGEWRPAEVKAYGRQELFKIKFSAAQGGISLTAPLEVIATANHRWFLANGQVTDALRVGDIIEAAPVQDLASDADLDAVQHGLIYGDGSAHKSRNDYPGRKASQGREYCAIRLCGEDKKYLRFFEGCTISYPPHAKGDPVVYLGKKPFYKDLPFTTDPAYINSFIYGWWMADGSKTYSRNAQYDGIEISTTSDEAIQWLKDYAAYADYIVTGLSVRERSETDGSYANGKALYSIRLAKGMRRKVMSIEVFGEDEVYCVEEPVTTGFVLANGLLTGNCSTAANSFHLFYLLLNGSGVGRDYSSQMMIVDWDKAPALVNTCRTDHPDYAEAVYVPTSDARVQQATRGDVGYIYFLVPDSREGWAKAAELYETYAFLGQFANLTLVLDWSDVRPKGSPIGGMQERPASGPTPTAEAFEKIAKTVVRKGFARWKQAMMVDHYLAECVLVGGARRSARMATMYWKDPNAKAFATFKQDHKDAYGWPIFYSSNNSLITTAEYYEQAQVPGTWANEVFEAATHTAYHDNTGEPGFINVDKFAPDPVDFTLFEDGRYADSFKYSVREMTVAYMQALVQAVKTMPYTHITNPCGEIQLFLLGGYCVIADVVPFHAETLDEAIEAFKIATRALIRTNLMRSLYDREVKRTNRIGVGFTGIFSFAIKFFKISFFDMLDEHGKGKDFWDFMARASRAVKEEKVRYVTHLRSLGYDVAIPVTDTTVKPAGSTSKLFALEEGAHLPAMAEYLRWMQYRNDSPEIAHYRDLGYPVRELTTYKDTTIVGFPTQPTICRLGEPELVVTAGQVSPEQNYRYLQLLEKYYIVGVDEAGNALPDSGNQVSYTLKYDPKKIGYDDFKSMMAEYQGTVRCCTVMPQMDETAYEYQPEEPISRGRFLYIVDNLKDPDAAEDFDIEHLRCASGSCPL